jgi:O-antigen/teichoic acid export membrane protein
MFLVMWITRSTLLLGFYTLATTLAAPIFEFSQLNLRVVQATEPRQSDRLSLFLCVQSITAVFATLASLIAGVCFGYSMMELQVIAAVCAMATIDAVGDVVHGLLLKHDHLPEVGISQLARSVLRVVLFSVGLWLWTDMRFAILLMAVASLVVALVWDARWARRVHAPVAAASSSFSWPVNEIVAISLLSLPLACSRFMDRYTIGAPRLVLNEYYDGETLGIFGGATCFLMVGQLCISAMADGLRPRLARSWNEDRDSFFRLWMKFVGLATLVGFVAIPVTFLVGPWALRLLGPEFPEHQDLLLGMVIASGPFFVSGIVDTAITSARMFGWMLPISCCGFAATILSSFLLVPTHGMTGAVWSTGLGNTVRLLASLGVVGWSCWQSQEKLWPRDGRQTSGVT